MPRGLTVIYAAVLILWIGGFFLGFFLRTIWDTVQSLKTRISEIAAPKKPDQLPLPNSTLVEPLSPVQEAARRLRSDVDRLN